jgi:translocation and assembly module TamA
MPLSRWRAGTRSLALWAPALACLLELSGCGTSKGQRKSEEPEIRSLTIQGAHGVSASDIESKLVTSGPSWVPFTKAPQFDPNAWRADLKRVERFYQSQGYYDAQVQRDEVVLHGNQWKVDLKLVLHEGEPTRVTEVNVEGIEHLPEQLRRRLRKELPFKPGQIFREEDWVGLKDRLRETLRDWGYAAALVEGEVVVEAARFAARVNLRVQAGGLYRFGEVTVEAGPHPRVSPRAVLRQVEGAFRQGDPFSTHALTLAQSRVTAMGVFGAVRITPGEPDPGTLTVPIVVEIREAPFHSVRTGPGFEVDPVRQEFRALAEYTDRNFVGGLRRLTVKGNVGYAFLPSVFSAFSSSSETTKQGVVGELSARLTQPDFLARDLKLELALMGSRGLDQAYNYWSARGQVGVSWHPLPSLTFFPSYNYEIDKLQGANAITASSSALVPSLVLGCAGSCVEHLSYLEQTLEWDKRNDKYDATSGYYMALSLQEGGGPLGGSFTYFRVLPDVRGYFTPLPRLTFALRIRAGTLLTPAGGTSPIVSRFFSGGDDMRGFGNRRLSPLLALPQTLPGSTSSTPLYQPVDGLLAPVGNLKVAGQTAAIGGDGLFSASIEARYALPAPVTLATFLDMGFVSACRFGASPVYAQRSSGDTLAASVRCAADADYLGHNMQYAVGFGVRLRLVIPVRLDLAYRPNIGPVLPVFQLPGFDVVYPRQGTCFGINDKGKVISGSPEGPCTFELSVGEAF